MQERDRRNCYSFLKMQQNKKIISLWALLTIPHLFLLIYIINLWTYQTYKKIRKAIAEIQGWAPFFQYIDSGKVSWINLIFTYWLFDTIHIWFSQVWPDFYFDGFPNELIATKFTNAFLWYPLPFHLFKHSTYCLIL